MKKYVLIIALLLLASCAAPLNEADFRCPNILIPGDKAYLTQIVNYADNFRIELTGYEGYCYVEDGLSRRYAVITPKFRVARLRDNDETQVDFQYFTEILQGPPEFVGKKTYFASGKVEVGAAQAVFSGRPVKVKIPLDNDEIEIILGLDVSAAEHMYNQRTFDTRTPPRPKLVQTPCGFIENTEEYEASVAEAVPAAAPAAPAPEISTCGSCTVRR